MKLFWTATSHTWQGVCVYIWQLYEKWPRRHLKAWQIPDGDVELWGYNAWAVSFLGCCSMGFGEWWLQKRLTRNCMPWSIWEDLGLHLPRHCMSRCNPHAGKNLVRGRRVQRKSKEISQFLRMSRQPYIRIKKFLEPEHSRNKSDQKIAVVTCNTCNLYLRTPFS